MKKWLHSCLIYNFLRVITLVIYSLISSPSFASQDSLAQISSVEKTVAAEVKAAYSNSWQEFTEQDIKSFHPFHFQHVGEVVDLHMSCDKPMSNTAAFGITIYGDKGQPINVFSFDLPVSSGTVKKSFGSRYVLSKTIIESLEQKYIAFFTKVFELNPNLRKTYTGKFKDIIEFIADKRTVKIDGLANVKSMAQI